jgi:predicted PurR-regulated permease PerM
VVACVVIGGLYWARPILIPIVLAIFLTPVLGPLVTRLERRRIPRIPAVLFVVFCVAMCIVGILWLLTSQITSVVSDLPKYSANITEKIKAVRQMADNPATRRLEKMIQEISGALNSQPASANPKESTTPKELKEPNDKDLTPEATAARVIVRPETPLWLSWVPSLLSSILDLLGGLALSLLLVVFMLLRREDLRNRVIRLLGHGRVTVTTKAVDDAGKRISRFLATQLIVNSIYGFVIGLGLWAIGVNYPLLWGFLAGTLRYLPYIGVWIAAIPPFLLSVGMFPSWLQPSLVVSLFFAMEMISGNFLEPRIYGHSIGVSEVALLIVASCWAFLWGPIGLLLSSPLTVCLVVLGKYVPRLQFLDVLLGDEAALEPDVSFYQRLLARDQDEATDLALALAKESQNNVCDSLLLPTLIQARRDYELGELTDADQNFIRRAIEEIMGEVEHRHSEASEKEKRSDQPETSSADVAQDSPTIESTAPKIRIVGCASRNPEDLLALEMLGRLLDPERWELEILSTELLSSELVEQAAAKDPPVVCIGALPPGGLSSARYLCKRLRARLPKTRIVIGRWGLTTNAEQNRQRLRECGADQIDLTIQETRDQLDAWRPVLVFQESNAQTRPPKESLSQPIPPPPVPSPAA